MENYQVMSQHPQLHLGVPIASHQLSNPHPHNYKPTRTYAVVTDIATAIVAAIPTAIATVIATTIAAAIDTAIANVVSTYVSTAITNVIDISVFTGIVTDIAT